MNPGRVPGREEKKKLIKFAAFFHAPPAAYGKGTAIHDRKLSHQHIFIFFITFYKKTKKNERAKT